MKSLLKVPANAIDRLAPDTLALDCALRARGMDDIADELLLARLEPGIVGIKVIGVPSSDPPVQASQVPLDHPYASGKAVNLGVTTLAAAALAAADLVTAGYQWLTLLARIGNATTPATALGDVVIGADLYEDDGTTVFPAGVTGFSITPDATIRAATLNSNIAFTATRFNLTGLDKVRAWIKNNNAAALQGATLIYYLQK